MPCGQAGVVTRMARQRVLISNFNAGEFSPRLDVRSDIQRFFAACALNENFHILTQGGVAKRMGTLVDGLTAGQNKALLLGFAKSASDALMLEFTALKMRVWLPDYTLVTSSPGVPYELATPWTEADLPFLAFSQSADVIFVTRRDCAAPLKVIRRAANNSWSLVDYDIQNGPFLPLSNPGVTLAASAVTGAITLTASAAVFNAARVGAIYRLRENVGNPPVNRWEAAKAVTAGDLRQNGGRVYTAGSTGTTGTTAPIHWEGAVSDGVIIWTFVHDGAGVAKITGFTTSALVDATVLSQLPSTGATTFWEEGAFSAANGFAACATIHQERLFLAQTIREPDSFYASATAAYDPDSADFKPGLGTGLVVDSDAVKRGLTGGRVRPILHLVSAGALFAFTPKSIEVITGPSDREPITPAGAAAQSRPGLGASPWVTPVRAAKEILYISFSGRRLMGLAWGENINSVESRDLSVFAEHLGRLGRFTALAICEDPEPTIWVLDEKGRLYAVAYNPEQDVVGWWRAPIMGNNGKRAKVESIAVMERPDGRDELWLAVNRDGVRTIEHMPGFLPPEAPRDLHCGLDGAYFWNQWNGDPARTVTLSGPLARDEQGTLAASTATFSAGDVGKEFWLRLDEEADDSVITFGPAKVQITAFTSTTSVTVKALTTIPQKLANVALIGWAFPLTTLTGLTAWAGRTARLFADGEDLGDQAIGGGASLVPPRATARGFVGAVFQARLQMLPLDVGSEIGTSFGGKVRADRFTVLVQNGVKLLVGPRKGEKEPILLRDASELMSQPASPRDRVRTVPFPGGFEDILDVEIIADGPWPCELAGVSLRVTSND